VSSLPAEGRAESPLAGRLAAALVLAATIALLAWHARQLQFFCDDSYISFRYAQNFAEGKGLVYNAGERVEGYTNFLWVVLLAAGIKMGFAVEPFSVGLGIAFLALTLAATTLLARRLLRSWPFALVPGLLLVAQGPMILWSVSGLESSCFAALTMVALLAYESGSSSWRRQLVAGALYASSTMVRPDGVVFGAAAGLHLVLAGLLARPLELRRLLARALALAGGFAALFAPFMLWRHHYYGDWLPNTFYVKAGGLANVALGLQYLDLWLREYALAGVLALGGVVAVFTLPAWRAQRRTFAHVALALLLFSAYLVWAGGDYMALYRFIAPMLPLAMIPAAALLRSLHDEATRQATRLGAPRAAVGLAGLALLAGSGYVLWQPTHDSLDGKERSKAVATVARMKRNAAQWASLGRAVKEKLPPSLTIATTAAGALPYFAQMKTIDQSGLCDRHTAKESSDPWLLDRPGHMKQATRAWLARQRPELVFWHPKVEEATTPPERFPDPPTPDYELRAMAVPELADEGLCAFLWVRKDAVNALVPRGVVPAKESSKLAKAKGSATSEKKESRAEIRRDKRSEEVDEELKELAASPPPAPPAVDPPLPSAYVGPVFSTERLHAADPASEEPRWSVDDVTRPLWQGGGAAEVELTGAAGSSLEFEVASPPRFDAAALAGAVAPGAVAVTFVKDGTRHDLKTSITTPPFAHDACWRTVRAELAGAPVGRGSLEIKVDGAPAGKGTSWLVTVPRLCQKPDPDTRPNVLIVTIDTLRADYLGCYGHDRPTSPHLDRLASEGVLFERNVSQSCWTLPSYSSTFTGLYPESHGVVHRNHKFEGRFVTFIEALLRSGYATAGIASGTFTDAHWGFDQGFESYDDLGMVLDESRARAQARNGLAPDAPEAMQEAAQRRVTSSEVANKAIAWLDGHRDRRFALFLHFFDPHEDYVRHPGVSDRFPARPPPRDFPNQVDPKPAVTAAMRALYEGEIAYTDQHVGRVLKRLDELGLAERTVVVVFADHGEAFKEHVLEAETEQTRKPGEKDTRNRGHGSSLFNEQVHVPLIFRVPGIAPARVRSPVGNIDIGPTLLELCGVEADDWRPQGRSLVELLRNPAAERGEQVLASLFFARNPRQYAEGERVQVAHRVDFQDLCAIEYEATGKSRGLELLFDWTKDRWQDYAGNLSGTMRDVFDRFHAYYEARRNELKASLKDGQVLETGADVLEKLAGLGYGN